MIVVNIVLSILILIGLLLYKYVYPKKKPNLLVLLIVISLLPVVSILRTGVYQSGDFNLHIYRSIDFYRNLAQGNFMPSWGGELNMTYGYPVFIFNYILTYYIVSILHFLGFTFIAAMKIFLASSFVSSGIVMYLWTRKIFKNDLQAFTSAIFFLFAPYHLVVLHFRVNGEILAFTFLPLILMFTQDIIFKPTLSRLLVVSLLYGLFYLAHPASAIFSLPIIILYTLISVFKQKKKLLRKLTYILLGCMIGMFLASYVFVAHLYLSQYTYTSLVKGGVSYTAISELLYSPWRGGFLFQGPKGELSFLIGYTQIFVPLLILYFLLRKRLKRDHRLFVSFWIAAFIFVSFLITPLSDFLWKLIPILSIAQFSYRLLLLVVFSVSVLAGYLVFYIKRKRFIYLLIAVTILYTILNWGNRTTIPEINDAYLTKNVPYASLNYEAMAIMASPKWLKENNLWEKSVPKHHLEIVNGSGEIREIRREETNHSYIIFSDSSITVLENTLFFPGWQIKIDNKTVSADHLNPQYLGKLLFDVSSGVHLVNIYYSDIPLYKIFKTLSALGYITITFLLIYLNRKKIKILKK